ncbi:hypothetical protein [Paenibacillus sacheonensis]|uniref:Uncharacterized protein n=1 Tax=Paenibacillus sacheonensis TaxID=742054 RepID=A0A7X4YL43_9BACL|nr:hypothetical protein [Paenibacillus sacheonensis]MBM7568803.1 hypothetical protein [Paenibacillus sacheonensis]NBC68366.1 hypothetical protein [Paenibacillus sacheonensis]
MIAVTIAFVLIAYHESRYLRSHRRSKRTVRLVLGFLTFLWLLASTVVLLHGRFSLGVAVTDLFKPLQQLLFIEE